MKYLSILSIVLSTFLISGAAAAQSYDLPFRADDLRDKERIYWGAATHIGFPTSVQSFGYDLGIARKVGNGWAEEHNGDTTKKENYFVYGLPVYAMRDGTVIACWRMAPENSRLADGSGRDHQELKRPDGTSLIYGGGNHVWVEHEDGTRAEYAHFQPGTVPASLCPNRNRKFLPEPIASPDVTQAWPHIKRRPFDRRQVAAGQFLGRVGYSGTTSHPHLHVHVERGGEMTGDASKDREAVEISFRRGLAKPFDVDAGIFGGWTSFAGNPIPPGKLLIWPPLKLRPERLSSSILGNFQSIFDHLSESGYQPDWIDGYTVGGEGHIISVWRPASRDWRAFFFIGENRFQDEVDAAIADGMEPVFVDSSVLHGNRAYSVVFARNVPGSFNLRHKRNQSQHEALMDEARANNLVPVNISVISIGGNREYTVLYRTGDIGDWRIRSRMGLSEFQSLYDQQTAQGRKPLYLNGYRHDGQLFVTAVFGRRITSSFKDRHNMSPIQFNQDYDEAREGDLMTRAATGFDGVGPFEHRFGALWWK